jgi:hypothetical protein
MLHRMLFLLGALALLVAVAIAAVPAPPPPPVWRAQVHYRINAFGTERIRQYQELMRFLARHGFVRDDVPEPEEAEDPTHVLVSGTVPDNQARSLLGNRNVKTIQIVPKDAKVPEDKKQLVRVDLQLAEGLTPEGQSRLHEQTREVLAKLNFRHAVGYDHRGYTRVLGAIPAAALDQLLQDLRKAPVGKDQTAPFPSVWAIRLTEVHPDLPTLAPAPRQTPPPPSEAKLTREVRDFLADKEKANQPRRLEVLLATSPDNDNRTWSRELLATVPEVVLEGRVGSVVAIILRPNRARDLAAVPEVLAIRLPVAARAGTQVRGGSEENWTPLFESTGLARLHKFRYRGKGTRVAVIDTDFSGWEGLRGKALLPGTTLVDLTAERNADLLPDPFKGQAPGPGARRAVTLQRAAPEAELTLVRIDPAAPYMLYQVARAIHGDNPLSLNLENRAADIDSQRRGLNARRDILLEERKLAAEIFEERSDVEKQLLAQAEKERLTPEAVQKLKAFEQMPREAIPRLLYEVAQMVFNRDEAAQTARVRRYLDHLKAVEQLRGIRVVTSALVWDEGLPVDGTSTLTRFFDDRPFRTALWFQAAGDVRGQSWVGPFRDADHNGLVELSPPEAPLPAGSWSPELSFLAWRHDGTSKELPAGARLRVTLQWREAHEAVYSNVGEDAYREPLARGPRGSGPPVLTILRQFDPEGKRRPADDMEIVAQSSGPALRLGQTPSGATYEVAVDLVVREAGRYAVRIEAQAPAGTLPRGAATVPAAAREGEMQLRLFVTTREGTGRAVWRDFVTDAGSLGVPGDARAAVTVGAANKLGQRQPYSAGGAPFAAELLAKPDLLAYDGESGTAEAAAFAAGVAAAVRSGGASRASAVPSMRGPGGLLQVPAEWPQTGR